MAQLAIRLLGGLQISRDGQSVPPPTPQRAALLARLLLFGERPQPRQMLAGLYRQALTRLIAHDQASGAVEQALDLAQRLVAADALQEDASRTLMKLYYQLGRRDRALAVYQSLRQKLAAELEIEPEPATTALFQSIQARLPEA